MTTHGETILKQIKDNNVKQVVFTGHSLGGSVAHVAHLYALATWADELVDVTFRVLSFEPTMVFFLPDPEERTDPLKAFLKDKLEKLARCGPRLTTLRPPCCLILQHNDLCYIGAQGLCFLRRRCAAPHWQWYVHERRR